MSLLKPKPNKQERQEIQRRVEDVKERRDKKIEAQDSKKGR